MAEMTGFGKALMTVGFLALGFAVVSMIAVNMGTLCVGIMNGGCAWIWTDSSWILPGLAGMILLTIGAGAYRLARPDQSRRFSE